MRLFEIESKINYQPYIKNLKFCLENNRWLYRGSKTSRSEIQIINYGDRYRPAKNTSDIYKQLLDKANPSWPQRGFSTICTTEEYTAWSYGVHSGLRTMRVVPTDGTVIGCVGSDDIWGTGVASIVKTVSLIQELISQRIDKIAWPGLNSIDDLVYILNLSKALIHKSFNSDDLLIALDAKLEIGARYINRPLLSWFKTVDDTNDIKDILLDVSRYENISRSFSKTSNMARLREGECWFEGPFLAIPLSLTIDSLHQIFSFLD